MPSDRRMYILPRASPTAPSEDPYEAQKPVRLNEGGRHDHRLRGG